MSKNSVIYQKISEKRKNLEQLKQFKQLTEELNLNLNDISNQISKMKNGTESVALILQNWQRVIQSISLASLGLLKYQQQQLSDKQVDDDEIYPETLVRINLNEEDDIEVEGEDAEEIVEEEEIEEFGEGGE
ncbi:DAD2 [Candida pseudojiufengensis]|uniref:DAD2 n=1 Tax=Candida pseudojiufengensis TaxID=497109 RepID=UPI002224B7E6|nr:DAD2 [Candida pseudojiufengensis]KAI5963270.1 DAD2 [Candida pseudojiufengensis]